MQQYYINSKLEQDIVLKDNIYHYLVNVVKVGLKENVMLFNGKQKAVYKVIKLNKSLKIIELYKEENLVIKKDEFEVDLAMGLLKKDNTELTVQKVTELGVNNIYLLNLKNNVVKIEGKEEKKLNRYNEISKNACEQSKRFSLVNIEYIKNKKEIPFEKYDYIYLLYENEENTLLYKEIIKIKEFINKKILLIVGPEGGFTNDELGVFTKYAKLVSINDNILRAETAAIIGVGITRAILQ